MKILISVHTYYPDKNGVQMVTQYIAEGLAKKHEVKVITELKENYLRKEIYNNVSIERIKINSFDGKFTGEKNKYLSFIKDYNPKVLIVVCTQSWPFDWVMHKLNDMDCIKILYTHGYSGLMKHYPIIKDIIHLRPRALKYHWHWMRYYKNAYKYIAQFDLVTYLSENNISVWYAKKHNLCNGEILVNAVENMFFVNTAYERVKVESAREEVKFIYVANYDSNKNQKFVLEAFYQSEIKNARLIFVGSKKNSYYKEVVELNSKLEREYGKRQIDFLYNQPRESIPDLLRDSDVFVCGSIKEEYPVMLCEAAAEGLPIISTRVGHAPTMPGCIVVDTQADMAAAMKMLCCNREERIIKGQLLQNYAKENYVIEEKVKWLDNKISLLTNKG